MRDSWDVYFMKVAEQVSTRGTCDRLRVGAVIVKDNQILSTGYNGSVRGLDHCDDKGHLMIDNHCVATIHGEVNAIIQAAKKGVAVEGASLYCNFFPCWNCFKVTVNAGIVKMFYGDIYMPNLPERQLVRDKAEILGIELIHIKTN